MATDLKKRGRWMRCPQKALPRRGHTHPQRPGSQGFWSVIRPQRTCRAPQDVGTTKAWYHELFGFTLPVPSMGSKCLLTEFLVNDL